MTDKALAVQAADVIESVIIGGDLSKLNPEQRVQYYLRVCNSLGLNPLTKPFDYIELDGRLVLYARRDCTDQLRDVKKISITKIETELQDGVYVVRAHAQTPDGRTDYSTGAVSLEKEDGEWRQAQSGKRYFAGNGKYNPLRGDARANAMMKAETKAKRRVTLSICGLGMLDETEVETIPGVRRVEEQPPAFREVAVEQPAAEAQKTANGNSHTNGNGKRKATPAEIRQAYTALCAEAATLGIAYEPVEVLAESEIKEAGISLRAKVNLAYAKSPDGEGGE